eukprot:8812322-Ditylum_brightwellii.AAC.1
MEKILADDNNSIKITDTTKKKDTGSLALHIPEPPWLTDPSYQTRGVTERIFEIKMKERRFH